MLTQVEIDSLYIKHPIVSVNEIKPTEKPTVTIFPNPTNESISIDLKKQYTNVQLSITDLLGNSVYKTTDKNSQITTIKLPAESGIYLLRMILDGEVVTRKVIKK
jgi:hypothetical protein